VSHVALTGIAKSYGAAAALRGASLDLRNGEVHALMGENGAGKSTLIKILAGAEKPDAGTIAVNGRTVVVDGPQAAHRLGFRFIHQELNVVPQLSVAENMILGRRYPRRLGLAIDWRGLAREARAALDTLALDHIDPRVPMGRLTAVDRMLVRIAAAFHDFDGERGRVHVLDEPTAALSEGESERLFAIIGQLVQKGCSVLYVSHRLDEVLRIADRITVLRDGATAASLRASTASRAAIIELMTGRTLAEAFPAELGPARDDVVMTVDGLGDDVIDDISFDLRHGEILGIAGLDGAARGGVLRALVGGASRGSVRLAGRRIRRRQPADGWRAGLAYVPGERRSEGIIASADVIANATLPHLRRLARAGLWLDRDGMRREVAATTARTRLKATGLGQRLWQLSGGNQQKVVFARAVAGAPRVLLLDEPTRGVDIGAKFDIYALLREMTAAGAAILLASSDLDELIGMSDRILVLDGGRMASIVPAGGLTPKALLGLCYGDNGGDGDA